MADVLVLIIVTGVAWALMTGILVLAFVTVASLLRQDTGRLAPDQTRKRNSPGAAR